MGGNFRLGPEARALVHAKAVLLVYHGQAEVVELDLVFYKCVGAEYQVYGTVCQPLVNFAPLFCLGAAGEQGYLHLFRVDIAEDAVIVLCGKYFCGCHDAGLIAVVNGLQGGEYGHQGLAAAHVALQQAVHLPAAGDIGTNLLQHPFLRTGKGEGEVGVCVVEGFAYTGEHYPLGVAHLYEFLLYQRELEIEELFKFKAAAGLLQTVHVGREVDVVQGFIQRNQPLLLPEILRQGLGYPARNQHLEFLLQLCEGLVGDAAALQFF